MTMRYPEWIWHNGAIKPWADATTHVMAHAERLCDRLTIIAGGRARFEGTVDDARASLHLVNHHSVCTFPTTPLLAIHRPKVTIFISPFIPYFYIVFF